MKTLVLASGCLLRSVEASAKSVRLEVVTPRGKKSWRIVPKTDVSKHVEDWAKIHGITLSE